MCKKELVGYNYECLVDKTEMIVNIFNMDVNKLDENFVDTEEKVGYRLNGLYIYSMFDTNPESNKKN